MNGSNWLQFLSDQGQTFNTLYLFQTNEQKGILDDIGKDGKDDNLRTAVAHQFAMERRLRKEIKVVQQSNKVLLESVDELARAMKKLTQKVNVRQIMSYL
jgi:predicted AAA+ superfamily ATPase